MTATLEHQPVTDQKTVRLTAAQAIVRYLEAQQSELLDGSISSLCGGVFGIYGHGNVAGIGEALNGPSGLTYFRGQNEQGMAHAAIAFAKANKGRRMMAVTTSIGPGATNLITAAALAHVNRLPVLFLPGDVFASRRPDPVLQQLEDSTSPLTTANTCFRPVSRYFDVITRPEQVMTSLPRAIQTMMDPETRGPATLCLPQDVQTEAFDFPTEFFEANMHCLRRPLGDRRQMQECASVLGTAQRPLIIAGGGVHYSGACEALAQLASRRGIPVAETQAGKGSLAWDHPLNLGGIGVTGTDAANRLAAEADVVLCVGTRLSDFTTASKTLFKNPKVRFLGLNVQPMDASKLQALPLVADALEGLDALDREMGDEKPSQAWVGLCQEERTAWFQKRAKYERPVEGSISDAQVLMAVNELAGPESTVVCAAGGLPGELHRHWNALNSEHYHLEYGYSCMGYEIAGGLGVKMAKPEREVYVLVGDGSYLMLHTELVTSLQLGMKLNVIVVDNQGFGCINRLQQAGGCQANGNLLRDTQGEKLGIDFAKNAESYGCHSCKVGSIEELRQVLRANREVTRTCVTVIETDPSLSTPGSAWWDVALAEVSGSKGVIQAHESYQQALEQVRRLW